MTREEAIKIAKGMNSNYVQCDDYEDVYVFSVDSDVMLFGGLDAPLIIDKQTGKLHNSVYLFELDLPEHPMASYKI